jgi:hypothetical protein
LELVAGTTHIIKIERGGIEAMLAEADKWDWREINDYTLPMLELLAEKVTHYRDVIGNTCSEMKG